VLYIAHTLLRGMAWIGSWFKDGAVHCTDNASC